MYANTLNTTSDSKRHIYWVYKYRSFKQYLQVGPDRNNQILQEQLNSYRQRYIKVNLKIILIYFCRPNPASANLAKIVEKRRKTLYV